MLHIAFLLAASLSTTTVAAENEVRDYSGYDFLVYLKDFGKSYADAELMQRRLNFEATLKDVLEHNGRYREGKHTWFLAVNEFSDWSYEEFRLRRGLKKHRPSQHPIVQLAASSQANPESIDWREQGAVTPVKNQGSCGSCWAFSATETMESHYQIASGKLLELAPQSLVNCALNPHHCGGKGGCHGATPQIGFNHTIAHGIALASDVPYVAEEQVCTQYAAAVKASGYVKNPVNSAIGLETALATKGPVSINAAAGPWKSYGGGIFQGCSTGNANDSNIVDHAIQVVGYTKDAWIVRNSWGPDWGEGGYIRLSRASDGYLFLDTDPGSGSACDPVPNFTYAGGECGILYDTSYPTGVHAASSADGAVGINTVATLEVAACVGIAALFVLVCGVCFYMPRRRVARVLVGAPAASAQLVQVEAPAPGAGVAPAGP